MLVRIIHIKHVLPTPPSFICMLAERRGGNQVGAKKILHGKTNESERLIHGYIINSISDLNNTF